MTGVQTCALPIWGSYVQLRTGGFLQFNFVSEFPVKYRPGARLATPPWDHPEFFNFRQHGADWDYFLVHGPSTVDPFAAAHDRVRLAKRSGEWELWEKLPEAQPIAPGPAPAR